MFKLPWFRMPDVSKFNNMIFLPIALYFAKGMTWMDVWYGFGIQSWIEYSVHRFVYHKCLFAKSHKFHHLHPSVYGRFMSEILVFPIAYFLYYFISTQLLSATILWFILVENVHITSHTKTSNICPHVLKRMHRLHHKYPNKNFGFVGGLLFDILCGTFMWKEDATLSRKQQKAAGSLKAT